MNPDYLLNEWSRLTTQHESIPLPSGVRLDSAVTGYTLLIDQAQVGDQRNLAFTITMFSKEHGRFFGRTFSLGDERQVFYISSIMGNEVVGICELLSIDPHTYEVESIGWAELLIFSMGPKESAVYRGTPRLLTHKTQQSSSLPSSFVKYEVRENPEVKSVSHILPPNTFIGPADVLPGIQGDHLKGQGVTFSVESALYVNQVAVYPARALEKKVMEFALDMQRAKTRNLPPSNANVKPPSIQERRLFVGLHNTWGYVGGGHGSVTFLTLTEQDTLQGRQLIISNAINHPLLALIFEVEYTLHIPGAPGQPSETISLTIAWAPYLGNRETNTEVGLLAGPGKSVSGKMLWEPRTAIDLTLNISVSTRDVGPTPVSINTPERPTPDIDRLRKQIDAEYSGKLKHLERELENERKRKTQAVTGPQIHPVEPPRSPERMMESAAQTHTREITYTTNMVAEVKPAYANEPDYSYLDAIPATTSQVLTQSKAFESLPEGPRQLSRADKARLVRSGIRGVMDYGESLSIHRPRLDVEAQDPLQASAFVIQFLAFRPSSTKVPDRLCFGFQFYNFPYHMTSETRLERGQAGVPWVLIREGMEPELVIKFEVEPSPWDSLDFAKYLCEKQLTIEIWDAESHMQIGFARVSLPETLRQGRPSAVLTKEFPVFESIEGDQVGSLQVMLRNQGVAASVRTQPSQHPRVLTGSQAIHKHKAKAKVIDLGHSMPVSGPEDNEDARKKLRVIEWKKSQGNKEQSDFWEKEKYLREVAIVRERYKPTIIKQVLKEYLSTSEKIFARTGQAYTFEYMLRNPHSSEECFTVHIDDPELKLVTNSSEWQWWISHMRYDRPPEFDMVTEDSSVVLKPGEFCPMLFKFVSHNPCSKMISAWIHQTRGSPLCALELEVVPEASPVDHIFRFFESEDRTVRLAFPPFLREVSHKPIIYCTLNKAVVQWGEQSEVSVELRTPPAPTITEFSLLAYEDPYCSIVKAHWKVFLHSLVGVDITTNLGQPTVVRLACPGDEARTVKLFSSDTSTVYFPTPHDQPFSLLPRSVNSLPITVRTDIPGTRRIRVHCADVYHKKLVHAWVVKIDSAGPSINHVYELSTGVGASIDKRISFVNRSQTWAVFHFRSSHPKVLELPEPRLALEAGATGYLLVRLMPMERTGQSEVCVFGADTEENMFEVMLFKIQYT